MSDQQPNSQDPYTSTPTKLINNFTTSPCQSTPSDKKITSINQINQEDNTKEKSNMSNQVPPIGNKKTLEDLHSQISSNDNNSVIYNKEVDLSGKKFVRSISNENPTKKYIIMVNKRPFTLKQRFECLSNKKENMDRINKSLVKCYDSLRIPIIKSELNSRNFFENNKISDSLPKMNLDNLLEEIHKYYEDEVKSKIRQNRFLEIEANQQLDKTSFIHIQDIICKYLGDAPNQKNVSIQNFLEKNTSKLLEKSNLSNLMNEIKELVRLQEENLAKFSMNLNANPHLNKSKFNQANECLRNCGTIYSINTEKHLNNLEMNSLKECEKIISKLQIFHINNEKVNSVLERNNLNHTLQLLKKIPFEEIIKEDKNNISVNDITLHENSYQQRDDPMSSLNNVNPFTADSNDGEKNLKISILEPNEEGSKSINRPSHRTSLLIDDISKIEQPLTPLKEKRLTPEKTSDIIGNDPKHQYVSNRLRKTLTIFNNFNKEVDEIGNIPTLSKKIPNISSIKKNKGKESLYNNNYSAYRSESCRNSIKKSLNFNFIRDNKDVKVKEMNKSNSVDSPNMKIDELDLETDTPRFLKTDLISKLLSFTEEDLKNVAMKNVSPQNPIPKLILKETNNIRRFNFFKEFCPRKEEIINYSCASNPILIYFKPNDVSTKYDNEIPQYKAKLNKFKNIFNIKYKKEGSLNIISDDLAKSIKFNVDDYKRNEEKIVLDYSLTECKLNRLGFDFNILNKNKSFTLNIESNICSMNINNFLSHKKNNLSYSNIVYMMVDFLKNKTPEQYLKSIAIKTEEIIKDLQSYYLSSSLKTIPFAKINNLVLHSFEIIDILLVGIKEYEEMNKEIKGGYLNIDSLKSRKILSFSSENSCNNSYSLSEIATFYSNKYKELFNCLNQLCELKEDLKNKVINESRRLNSFKSDLNIRFITKLKNSFQDNLTKAIKSSGDCRNLIEISRKIEEYDKRLPDYFNDIKDAINSSVNLEVDSKMNSEEKARNQRSVVIHPSAQKDLSLFVCGDENSILTHKLNNFDKKNLKRKQIIDNLRAKEVESFCVQLVKEAERIKHLEKEKEILIQQSKNRIVSPLDYINKILYVFIAIFLFLILSKIFIGKKAIDQYPVELIINE